MGFITGLSEVTLMGGGQMERYASREPFGFEMAVLLGSAIEPTTVNKFTMDGTNKVSPTGVYRDIRDVEGDKRGANGWGKRR